MDEQVEFGGGETALAVAQEYVEQALQAEGDQPKVVDIDTIMAQMGKNPLPDGYISATLGPNRKARRAAHRFTQRRLRRFETWKRTLLAYGINPEDVMLDKRERRKIKPLPPKQRTRTTSHNQRRRAAHAGLATRH